MLGSHEEESQTLEPARFEIAISTYDSRDDAWVACTSKDNARLPAQGRTDLAIVGDNLFFGGQVTTGTTVRRPGGRVEHVWDNKIFWVKISTSVWKTLTFHIPNPDYAPAKYAFFRRPKILCCQAPRVVQCQPEGAVYAITRQIKRPMSIEIWEVEIVSLLPTGAMKFVTTMPHELFYTLFHSISTQNPYDCTAGLHYVAIMVPHPSHQGVAVYDIKVKEWFLSHRPIEPQGQRARYSMSRCDWTPNFDATP